MSKNDLGLYSFHANCQKTGLQFLKILLIRGAVQASQCKCRLLIQENCSDITCGVVPMFNDMKCSSFLGKNYDFYV